MAQASISFNGNKINQKLDLIVRVQLPWIATKTLQKLAQGVKEDLRQEMQTKFKNPNSWTLNSIGITPSNKTRLITEIFHKDVLTGARKNGNPAAFYLRPQVLGGEVYKTKFQQRLIGKGFMQADNYMMPVAGWGKGKAEYQKALWGISAMKPMEANFTKTRGSYVHVPRNLVKDASSEVRGTRGGLRTYAQNVRALNNPKGKKMEWNKSIPRAGIYKVMAGGLKPIFEQRDNTPRVQPLYKFRDTGERSVKSNFQQFFDQTVKEVIG